MTKKKTGNKTVAAKTTTTAETKSRPLWEGKTATDSATSERVQEIIELTRGLLVGYTDWVRNAVWQRLNDDDTFLRGCGFVETKTGVWIYKGNANA